MTTILPGLADVHDDVLEWTNTLLAERGIAPVSELTMVREMAWSMVARVDHAKGVWYFKLLPTYFSHELTISELLHRTAPGRCAEVIASDLNRGWLMVKDAGPMFRQCFAEQRDPSLWFEALRYYAELQIALMNSHKLQGTGIPDRSINKLPELVEPYLEQCLSIEVEDDSERFLPEHKASVEAALANWAQWIEPLYQAGIGDTIHHGDLHDGNLAYNQGAVIFDWGDCSLSHPFTSLRTVFASITSRFELTEDSPELEPFILAYLEPWQQFAPYETLRQMVESARKVSPLVSFLSWSHAIQNKADSRATRYEYALPALLREFVDAQE